MCISDIFRTVCTGAGSVVSGPVKVRDQIVLFSRCDWLVITV